MVGTNLDRIAVGSIHDHFMGNPKKRPYTGNPADQRSIDSAGLHVGHIIARAALVVGKQQIHGIKYAHTTFDWSTLADSCSGCILEIINNLAGMEKIITVFALLIMAGDIACLDSAFYPDGRDLLDNGCTLASRIE